LLSLGGKWHIVPIEGFCLFFNLNLALSVGEGVTAFGGDRRGSAGVSARDKVKVVWQDVPSYLHT
jgi:hypothetical protein